MGKFSNVKHKYTIAELNLKKKDELVTIVKQLEIELKYFKNKRK